MALALLTVYCFAFVAKCYTAVWLALGMPNQVVKSHHLR